MGVQGQKRRRYASADVVATVDPDETRSAEYRDLVDVPLDTFDAALLCVPDAPKMGMLRYLLGNAKHVLVEKPLWAEDEAHISEIQSLARARGVVCYTAYNHRFEPHFVRMRDVLATNRLGRIYSCRMFYGNGTARLVRESEWRDEGAGVVTDLGSHLLDTVRFWFGDLSDDWRVWSANRFENRAPDHAVIALTSGHLRIECEITLLMWRNHFTCDVLAENGSAHISSLCKWGPSTFTHRTRAVPAGRPEEEVVTEPEGDPTWALEYAHFSALVRNRVPADLSGDVWLHRNLRRLGSEAMLIARP